MGPKPIRFSEFVQRLEAELKVQRPLASILATVVFETYPSEPGLRDRAWRDAATAVRHHLPRLRWSLGKLLESWPSNASAPNRDLDALEAMDRVLDYLGDEPTQFWVSGEHARVLPPPRRPVRKQRSSTRSAKKRRVQRRKRVARRTMIIVKAIDLLKEEGYELRSTKSNSVDASILTARLLRASAIDQKEAQYDRIVNIYYESRKNLPKTSPPEEYLRAARRWEGRDPTWTPPPPAED